jgi:hypothetical protein
VPHGALAVPALSRFEGGREIGRTYGWDRGEWERLMGIAGLGRDLAEARSGCGAKNIEPGVPERRKIRFNETGLKSRRITLGEDEDEHEAMFARGWSDGLPLNWGTMIKSMSSTTILGGPQAPFTVGSPTRRLAL